jgi:hypothetical protein
MDSSNNGKLPAATPAPGSAPAGAQGMAPAPVLQGTGGAAPALAASEKRRNPRFKCEGTLELKTDGSTIRTWASFTDLSSSGCYVEMMTTFPVGTKMELQLGMKGFLVVGSAVVRATYPFLGMGIEFLDLSPNSLSQLESMIDSLAASRVRRLGDDRRDLPLPAITQPHSAIEAILHHFRSNKALTLEQFRQVATATQPRESTTLTTGAIDEDRARVFNPGDR